MFHVPDHWRIAGNKTYGNNGIFALPYKSATLKVIASDGEGWEHVSVSLSSRIPNWYEMCYVKDVFWDEEDVVMQLHPRKSEYVNNHPNVLHLWRPTDREIPTPPRILV